MEPRIQYAKTSDGVNIAYQTLGEGIPLVYMPSGIWSHIQLEWQFPDARQWYQRLADKRRLIRYDGRGSGLSERNVTDFSIGSLMLDVQAVVDRLGLGTFALWAAGDTGPVALAYAAQHPERVSHLLLWCSYARSSDIYRSPVIQTLLALTGKDWQIWTETAGQVFTEWSDASLARAIAAFMRESTTAEAAQAAYEAFRDVDVAALLPDVSCPVLVLQRQLTTGGTADVNVARSLASTIPDARLVILEGASPLPYVQDVETAAAAIDEFLAELEGRVDEPTALPSGTAVILFADIVDSTALTERLGDAAFRAKARELDGALRGTIREHAGTAIEGKLLGDGVLAVFTSARQAIEAALACGAAGSHAGLPLHLGLHAGDVIREEGNVYGGAVNIASRISGLSAPGQVLVSDTVRSLARTSAGVGFDDRGEQSLKGVGEPVRVYEVRWREDIQLDSSQT